MWRLWYAISCVYKGKTPEDCYSYWWILTIIFGIKGNRWENPEYGIWATNDIGRYPKLFNEYWIRPYGGSQVKGSEKVDDNCYW